MENQPDLVPMTLTTSVLPAVDTAASSVQGYLTASIAANTRRAYASQWRTFVAWGEATGYVTLPADPGTVAAYLATLADSGKKTSTIDCARAAIRKAHEAAGYTDPTAHILVTQTLRGIRRAKGTAPTQKAPLLTADIRRLLSVISTRTLSGKRDRALLLVTYALGARRSEATNLCWEDIEETPEGLRITIRHSKTDQQRRGSLKAVVRGEHPDTCPVAALVEWKQAAGIASGPVFRRVRKGGVLGGPLTAQSVALIIKETAHAAKLDPAKYSGHSLRAGMISQAAANDVPLPDIMAQASHRSVETTMRYIRRIEIFENSASAHLGL